YPPVTGHHSSVARRLDGVLGQHARTPRRPFAAGREHRHPKSTRSPYRESHVWPRRDRVPAGGPVVRCRRIAVSAVSVAACLASSVGSPASADQDDLVSRLVAGLAAVQFPGAVDTGVATGTKAVSLVLSSRDEQGLDAYVASPHVPLSAQEFAARFGPSPESLALVHDWAS